MLPTSSSFRSTLLITCPEGLSHFLRKECEEFGYPVTGETRTGITVEGSIRDAMRLNLVLATGHRVMILVDEFAAASADDLYARITALPWESVISPDGFLSVTSTVLEDAIRDTRFANLRCKDAVVDRLTRTLGRRCNSGSDRSGAVVHLHWKNNRCRLFIDTTGEPLSRRGYRRTTVAAPMQETLAAAVVRAARHDGGSPFVNPMCGSGTLAIEAALRALRRPPGLTRDNFAFMHLLWFRPEELATLRKDAKLMQRETPGAPIIATDIDPKALDAARANAQTAGVDRCIEFAVGDFADVKLPASPGAIVMNPEYGKRMGDTAQLAETYRRIGGFFKHACAGWRGYVFTGNLDLPKYIGLKASRRMPFRSGDIECRLYEYELYAGSRTRTPNIEGEREPDQSPDPAS